MTLDPRELVGGWATDTLTPDERRILLRAALEDQELFDELVDEEPFRQLLADASARRELLAVLDRPPLLARLGALVLRPAALTAMAAAAALALAVGVVLRLEPAPGTGVEVALASGPARSADDFALDGVLGPWASERMRGEVGEARVELLLDREGGVYDPGSAFRVGFRADREADAYLVEASPDGLRLLFPNRWQASPRVAAGVLTLVPPDGEGNLLVAGPEGRRALRLYLFEPGTGPAEGGDHLVGFAEEGFEVVREDAR